MKAKFNYKSKKTIIIIAIAAILLVAAIVGTVAFIKGNQESAAAMTGNEEISTPADNDNNGGLTGSDTQNSGDEQENPQIPTVGDEDSQTIVEDGNATANENGGNADNNAANNNAGTTNNGTTGTTTGTTATTVPNQEYTQTTTIITENPWETTVIGWTPITVSATTATTRLNINKATLENTKLAFINVAEDVDLATATPVDTAAQKGDIITYVIKVKNTSDIDATNIKVLDSVPEGTTLLEDSISDEGKNTGNDISWRVKVAAGEEKYVSFKVEVTADQISLIDNIAKVDGAQDEGTTTHTPIITKSKSAMVVIENEDGTETLEDRDAKVGETIRYIITIVNETDYDGITQVLDRVPVGTTLIPETITGENASLEDGVITWKNVVAKANSNTTVSFDVTVNKEVMNEETKQMELVTSVKNTAVVGGHNTEDVETKVANITTTKSSVGIRNGQQLDKGATLHEFDVIEYTLTATNSGNGEGSVVISDEVPEGTTLVEGSIKLDGEGSYSEKDLNDGITVSVGAYSSKSVTFKVTVNKLENDEVHIKNDVAKQDGTTITPGTDDRVEKEYVTVTANKEFDDNENEDNKRPTSVELELYADDVATGKKATTDAANGWKVVEFTELDKYTDDGEIIEYTVKENNINEYYTASYAKTSDGDHTTIEVTNKLKYEEIKISVKITKKWDDNNNENRPTEVEIGAYNGSETPVKTAKATSENGWIATFEDLPKYTVDGQEIEYTFKEVTIPDGYVATVVDNTVTNALPRLEVIKTVKTINGTDATTVDNSTVKENDVIEYEIKVKNIGSITLKDIEVTESLDVYLEADKPEKTTKSVGRISELEPEQEQTFTVYYKVVAEDVDNIEEDLVNVATATGKYTDGNGNEKDVTKDGETSVTPEEKNDLNIIKSQKVNGEDVEDDTRVVPGDKINYTITVTNTGNTVLTNVEVTDSMLTNSNFVLTDKDGFTLEDGKLIIATLELNETKTITATYTVQETDMSQTVGTIANTATAKSDKVPEKPAIVEVPTEAWYADITTTKTSEGSASPLHELDTITYKLTATNSGNDDGSVVIADTVPQGTKLVENSIRLDGVDTSYTETQLNDGITVYLNAGETKTLTFKVTINPFETEKVTIVNDEATQDGNKIPGTSDEVEKEYTSVTVNKTWVDNEIQAQRRPDAIRFELYADDNYTNKYYDMSTVEDTNSYTFDKLSKYNSDGTNIVYTIREKEINTGDLKFYTSSSEEPTVDPNGNKTYDFTNTFTKPTDTKSITVTKKWEDNNNAAGKRTPSVKLHLNNEEVVLTAENADTTNGNIWSTLLTKPVYNDNGEEITYTLTEKEENVPQWYVASVSEYTVTNTFKAPTDQKYDITIIKVWDDNSNEANKRPEKITLTLNKIDVDGNTVKVKDIELTGDATAAQWTATENVQKYDEKANKIHYFVVEDSTDSIFYINTDTVTTDLTTTNKFVVPEDKAEITIRKVWNDNNNETKRTSVIFAITGNGATTNATLTSENAKTDNGNIWEKQVNTLPKYDSLGNVIEYTFDEVNVPTGYIKTLNGNEITNSLPGIKVTKTVVKVNDQSKEGIDQITVEEDNVIEYMITVENIGTVDLTNVKVTDNLDVYTDKTNPEATTKTLLDNGTLAVGETKTYTVYYKVTANDVKVAKQLLKNTATATGEYTDSNNNKQTVKGEDYADVTIADAPGVKIEKSQTVNGETVTEDTKVKPGDEINYTITVTNTGNTVLNDVKVTDSMTGKEGFTIGTLNIGTLGIAPNNVATITATYIVQESDMKETESTIANTATVSTSTTPDASSTVQVTTEEWKADISVIKSSELIKKSGNTIAGKAEYGDTIKYTITATNVGKKTGTIDITDKVPTGTELIPYEDNNTNLTSEELAKLATEAGLTKTLNVTGVNSTDNTSSIYFTVKVTAKPGEDIVNTATISDGTQKSDDGNSVEKSVKVTKQTTISTITNSNVVIVLDLSSSMVQNTLSDGQTRLAAAKTACNTLISGISFDSESIKGSSVAVVTFSSDTKYIGWGSAEYIDNATTIGTATTTTEANSLKTTISNLTTDYEDRGTRIAAGLAEAKTRIEALSSAKPDNNNIVIVLSDGDFKLDDWDNNTLSGTGGETKSRVESNATALKNSTAKPTVYTVAFGSDAISSELNLLRDTIASSASTYYTATDSLSSIISAFQEMGSAISPAPGVDTPSEDGLIELTNIDINKDITIRVKANGETNFVENTGKLNVTENPTEADTYIQGKITSIDGEYYLDLSKFEADDTIEIDYFEVESQNNTQE